QKIFIKNKYNKNLSVIIETNDNQKGLVFVMHGLGGFKEQPHMETFAKVFKDNEYTVVRFDTSNTIGESEGNYEDATISNYHSDLEDVISWAKKQKWYQEPFILVGHSLGGICTTLYAENHPDEIKAIAPISTVVSGKLSLERSNIQEELKKWEETGWEIKGSELKPGVIRKLKWSYIEDRSKHDLLEKIKILTMPVLLIVGENDDDAPLGHHKILFNNLPGKKELHIIKDAPHIFKEEKHLREIYNIFDNWIKSLN
ncbi:alpha/beta hydrolase, partial [Patescibacteria group bacterium]|nr:alpha/beta hydrolase [Patescibacteria group bacterium]